LSLQCDRHYYSCQALYELVEYNDDDYDGIITTIINNNISPLLIFFIKDRPKWGIMQARAFTINIYKVTIHITVFLDVAFYSFIDKYQRF